MNSTKQNHHCFYIDNSGIWWEAESIGHPSEGDICPLDHCSDELRVTLQQSWSEVISNMCGEVKRIILYLEEDGSKHFATFGRNRKLIV